MKGPVRVGPASKGTGRAMPQRSPFDYDVSVSADKRKRVRRRGFSGAFDAAERQCDHPYCSQKAEYRAPRSPEQLEVPRTR